MELKSVRRVDFSLAGSFADMVPFSSLETAAKSHFDGLFVLTRPGKVQFFCTESFSALIAQPERKSSVSGTESPVVIPTSDPQMTAAKVSLQTSHRNSSIWLSEVLFSVTNGLMDCYKVNSQLSLYLFLYRRLQLVQH